MANGSSILAWKIVWTEEHGGLQSMGPVKIQTRLSIHTHTHVPELVITDVRARKEPGESLRHPPPKASLTSHLFPTLLVRSPPPVDLIHLFSYFFSLPSISQVLLGTRHLGGASKGSGQE